MTVEIVTKEIRSLVKRLGYDRLFEEYDSDEEALKSFSQEFFVGMDLTLPFEDNEQKIKDLFYDRNGIGLYFVLRKGDVKDLYELLAVWYIYLYKKVDDETRLLNFC